MISAKHIERGVCKGAILFIKDGQFILDLKAVAPPLRLVQIRPVCYAKKPGDNTKGGIRTKVMESMLSILLRYDHAIPYVSTSDWLSGQLERRHSRRHVISSMLATQGHIGGL
jgi:hypothetical protein